MKKILSAVMFSILATGSVFAQTASLQPTDIAPTSSTPEQVEFNVVNISMDNRDAQVSGARPGDVLRYELILRSHTQSVAGFTPSVDISEAMTYGDIIDYGLGNRDGGSVRFPAVTQQAPFEKNYTFFVRIKEGCSSPDQFTVTSDKKSLNVKMICQGSLAKSGPADSILLLGFFTIAGVLLWKLRGHHS